MLAIVRALTKWKQLTGNRPVTVETGHATLGRMLTQQQATTRLGYRTDKLGDFSVKVVYRPAKNNFMADAICRRQEMAWALHGREEQDRRQALPNRLDWGDLYRRGMDCPRLFTPTGTTQAGRRKGGARSPQ